MKDLVIIGAGGFGREIKCLIDDINAFSSKKIYNILGFIDDAVEPNTLINGMLVLGNLEYLNALKDKPSIVFGIGDPAVKKKMFLKLQSFDFPLIIHPSVSVTGDQIQIGKGSIICKGSILTCNIQLEDFVTVNLSCTIGHDSVIKSYTSLMPAVNCSGEVVIEEGVYIGTGAKIINQVAIGDNTIIGAGAVVSKSLPANCTAVGIPAKAIKFHKNDE